MAKNLVKLKAEQQDINFFQNQSETTNEKRI